MKLHTYLKYYILKGLVALLKEKGSGEFNCSEKLPILEEYTLKYYLWSDVYDLLKEKNISSEEIDKFCDELYWKGSDGEYQADLDLEFIDNEEIKEILSKVFNKDITYRIINN